LEEGGGSKNEHLTLAPDQGENSRHGRLYTGMGIITTVVKDERLDRTRSSASLHTHDRHFVLVETCGISRDVYFHFCVIIQVVLLVSSEEGKESCTT